MRSLWTNFTILENTLFELQKVGNELASSSGHRRCCTAHALSLGETLVALVETNLRIADIEKIQKERN
jgi:hypothetical protein